jgi:hypothetical protein
MTDVVEFLIFDQEAGPTLAGAIELVSPANKDRPAHRDAFVSKCSAFVQQGIRLMIVDVVTDRSADLHAELLARLQSSLPAREPRGTNESRHLGRTAGAVGWSTQAPPNGSERAAPPSHRRRSAGSQRSRRSRALITFSARSIGR